MGFTWTFRSTTFKRLLAVHKFSFLVAKSILQTVSQKRPKLLAGGWWTNENFGRSEKVSDAEERRIAHRSSNDLRPIRAVQVAWALIKLDDTIFDESS